MCAEHRIIFIKYISFILVRVVHRCIYVFNYIHTVRPAFTMRTGAFIREASTFLPIYAASTSTSTRDYDNVVPISNVCVFLPFFHLHSIFSLLLLLLVYPFSAFHFTHYFCICLVGTQNFVHHRLALLLIVLSTNGENGATQK